jgi:hypothetical protein
MPAYEVGSIVASIGAIKTKGSKKKSKAESVNVADPCLASFFSSSEKLFGKREITSRIDTCNAYILNLLNRLH